MALAKIYKCNADIDRVMSKLKAISMSQGNNKSGGESYKDLFGSTYLKAMFVVFRIIYPIFSFALLPAIRRWKHLYDVFKQNLCKCIKR